LLSGILATVSVGIAALAFVFIDSWRGKTLCFAGTFLLISCSLTSAFLSASDGLLNLKSIQLKLDFFIPAIFVASMVGYMYSMVEFEFKKDKEKYKVLEDKE
ncbi:hypothetical protein QI30_18725, partial [Kurthia sp. 3B1D]